MELDMMPGNASVKRKVPNIQGAVYLKDYSQKASSKSLCPI